MDTKVKSKFVSGIFWKFSERILSQVISLVVAVLLARILSPRDFGVVGIVLVFFSFFQILISAGFNAALIQKKDADADDYSTILYISVFIALVVYVSLFVAAPYIARCYGIDLLTSVIRVMGLILPVAATQSVWTAYVSAHLQFKKFFLSSLGAIIVSGCAGVWMALHNYGVWALVTQQMLNIVVSTLILVFSTKIDIVPRISIDRFKELFSYGWKILISNLIGRIYLELNPLFIGLKYAVVDLSYYVKGRSFPDILSSTLVQTFSTVLFPVLARYQNDKTALLNYTRQFMRLSSFVVFPAMIGLMAVADNFIKVILTDKWIAAVPYLQIFALAMMFDVVAVGNCETIKAMGRSDIYLIMEIIKKAGYFITIGLFMYITSSPQALACSLLVCEVIAILVNTYPNRNLIGYTYIDQLVDLLPNLLMASVMGIVVYQLRDFTDSVIWNLLIQIIVGIVIYIGVCVVTGNQNFKTMINLLKNRIGGKV